MFFVGNSRNPTKMSFLPPPPSEFPLPRAVHYELVNSIPSIYPIFKIFLVESLHSDGTQQSSEVEVGTFAQPYLFYELQDLYNSYSIHGGFVFSKDSIAMRMQSMDRVLCWFGFRNGIKYTCFVERCPGCAPTYAPPSPESPASQVPASNEPTGQ
jgi:hypothetical protein